MKNEQNRLIYRRWAPFYDQVIGRWSGLNRARRRSISLAHLHPGERVLFVGVGTGLDLPLLSVDLEVTGVDLSSSMLERAHLRGGKHPSLRLLKMNAETLAFPDGSFDVAFLHLILSVVEQPQQALSEAIRVLRPEGRCLILDKFTPVHQRPSKLRRFLNLWTTRLGTDIERSWEPWIEGLPVEEKYVESAWLRGSYQIICLRKKPQG
ncbi:class I SAM-dependent methyltransferase [Salinithrix halophila]|uniref:Class I SAM-dependent methyltransferase n=1 Tax=Salinithrix halophila TaxID=1485204 RepID=A0ABV8JFQ3_9BACL